MHDVHLLSSLHVVSPTLDSESVRFMDCSGKTFGEIVCVHELGGALDADKPAIRVFLSMIDITPKEMILGVEILSPGGDSLICGKEIGTLVVFKDDVMHFNRFVQRQVQN